MEQSHILQDQPLKLCSASLTSILQNKSWRTLEASWRRALEHTNHPGYQLWIFWRN